MTAPEAPQITWEIAGRDGWKPNTWLAEFGAGYLVLHASPQGNETMVYVPHRESRLVIDWEERS